MKKMIKRIWHLAGEENFVIRMFRAIFAAITLTTFVAAFWHPHLFMVAALGAMMISACNAELNDK